jgi:CheY-like chemotaxis protein
MTNRLALIVDDSRSARHILTRMLESFGLEVASVESAELALTYLQTARPDVIFMDHLMPGMDGFAAVRVLKANPDTVTIPVLMYTSQEGELYLSQARALGAIGVLPKTLKHSDVAAALQQLGLLAPDKGSSGSVYRPTTAAPPSPSPSVAVIEVHTPAIDSASETTTTQIPAQELSQLARRVAAEVREELLQLSAQRNRRLNAWRALATAMGVACLALLAQTLSLQYQSREQLDQLQAVHNQLQLRLNQPVAQNARPDTAAVTVVPDASPITSDVLPVAYGEVPFAGVRLERLRSLVSSLRSEQRKAVIYIETFTADFCLSGTADGIYVLTSDEMLLSSCDLVGNPFGNALSVTQRQSVAFANLLNSINQDPQSNLNVQLVDGGHRVLQTYPERTAALTAGEWNRVAERNQRVEFSVRPLQ